MQKHHFVICSVSEQPFFSVFVYFVDISMLTALQTLWSTLCNEAEWVAFALYVNLLQFSCILD